MNLIEKSEKIYKEIDALKDNKTALSNASKFNNFSSLLTPIYEELVEIEVALEIFIQNSIQVPANTGIKKSIVKVEDFKKKFNENSEIVLDPFPGINQRNYFFDPLKETSQTLKDDLKSTWKNWMDKKIKFEINTSAFGSLKEISSYQVEISDLERNYLEFQSLSNNLPETQDVIPKINKLIEKIEGIWGALDNIPDEVLAFLQKASSMLGASYSELSNIEVKKWLESNKQLIQRIKIRLN